MNLSLNHNIAAEKNAANVRAFDRKVGAEQLKISSGDTIHNAKDNPTVLKLSEQLKYFKDGSMQASKNAQNAERLIQTAESALDEVQSGLIRLRQLTVQASNEGTHDIHSLNASQEEAEQILNQINNIAKFTTYADKPLLGGEFTVSFLSTSDMIHISDFEEVSRSSERTGFEIEIFEDATKAKLESNRTLTDEEIKAGNNRFAFIMNGQSFEIHSEEGDDLKRIAQVLNHQFITRDIPVRAEVNEEEKLILEASEYGSKPFFQFSTDLKDFYGNDKSSADSILGQDVKATIDGIEAIGNGREFTGVEGSDADALELLFENTKDLPVKNNNNEPIHKGSVILSNNSMGFQLGTSEKEYTKQIIPDIRTDAIGRNTDNESDFKSVSEVNLMNHEDAQSSILVVDKALDEISEMRAELGSFQRNMVEELYKHNMRESDNNLFAYSTMRDTDAAASISELAKNTIMKDASLAILSQANKETAKALSLLIN